MSGSDTKTSGPDSHQTFHVKLTDRNENPWSGDPQYKPRRGLPPADRLITALDVDANGPQDLGGDATDKNGPRYAEYVHAVAVTGSVDQEAVPRSTRSMPARLASTAAPALNEVRDHILQRQPGGHVTRKPRTRPASS